MAWGPIGALILLTVYMIGANIVRTSGGAGILSNTGGTPEVGAGCYGTPTTLGADDSTTVQNAITAASNGDCIQLPASGTETWSATINMPGTKYITLDLNGSTITLSGASGEIIVGSNASGMNRVTNGSIVKDLDNNIGNYEGPFKINDEAGEYGIRVDHIAFSQTGTYSGDTEDVWVDVQAQGPCSIDNNTFTGMLATQEFVHFNGWGASSDTGWTTDSNDTLAGGSSLCYLEDSTLTAANSIGTNTPVIQGYYGARVGYRYNAFDYTRIDMHGTAASIGQRWWEIYENTFENNTNNTGVHCTLNVRAGTGVIHDQVFDWGDACFCEEDSGYPANYQVGRGQNNGLDPAYMWSYSFTGPGTTNGGMVLLNDCDASAQANMILTDRDIYFSARPGYSSFDYPHPLRYVQQ